MGSGTGREKFISLHSRDISCQGGGWTGPRTLQPLCAAWLAVGTDGTDPISSDVMAAPWSGTCEYLGSQMEGKDLRQRQKCVPGDPVLTIYWKRSHQVSSLSQNGLIPVLPLEAPVLERNGRDRWMNGITSVKWNKC